MRKQVLLFFFFVLKSTGVFLTLLLFFPLDQRPRAILIILGSNHILSVGPHISMARVGCFERIALKHTHTTCKISRGSWLYHTGHPKPALCDNLEGWGWKEAGGGFRREGTYVCLWPIHVDIWQKQSQYCNYPPIKMN